MSKIIQYKEEIYDFESLIWMSKDNNLKKFIDENDEVSLLDSGEVMKIKDLAMEFSVRNRNAKETLKHLPQQQRNKINKAMNEGTLLLTKEELWLKFNNDNITIEELESLMLIENKNLNVQYKKGFYVNRIKDKPIGLSDDYYGKFFRLLHLMNFGNTLRHDNSKPIKKLDMCNYLDMKTDRAFEIFIKALSNKRMIAKTKINDINYLIVNPAYATMNIQIDKTTYDLFKDDLNELLSPLEIKYLEMSSNYNKGVLAYE